MTPAAFIRSKGYGLYRTVFSVNYRYAVWQKVKGEIVNEKTAWDLEDLADTVQKETGSTDWRAA